MLVDNSFLQPSFFSATPSSSYPEYSTDFSDIFDTDLFNSSFTATTNSTSPDSGGSTPQTLLTPPQEVLPTFDSFPLIHDDDTTNQFYALFDDDLKAMNNPRTSVDFMGVNSGTYGDVSNMGMNIPLTDDPIQMGGIDPQLVDTPSAHSNQENSEEEQESPSPSDIVKQPEQEEKLSFTIPPVKAGGFGKARKGTVHSGGVVKKTTSALHTKEKENSYINALPSKDHEDDDDLPEDWRPSPEVLAKMTSKEKRQLRNKISARNFRVRRKEYITTLEGDIAERDRLLEHFRTQLGSQESENLALRQEIAALKKALLEGRGGSINLPPPAPLPEQSAAETLAASNTNVNATTFTQSPLLTANTQKDLPTSPRIGGPRFWGGVGMGGGGITPVHTTLVPDISTIVRNGLQENMNPALNAIRGVSGGNGLKPDKALGGFDGFADLNPFTMKTMDAYRMHLWGKMAAQQHTLQQNPTLQNHQNPSGLASNLRPHFFSASPKANLPPSTGYSSTLSTLLSGKHNTSFSHPSSTSSSAYLTPPTSPLLPSKGGAPLPLPLLHSSSSLATSTNPSSSSQKESEHEKAQQHAMLAAMASQTVFRKLSNVFWDAFIGSPSSSSSRSDWDADKVRKVLEGKAVLRVVDLEPATTLAGATASITSSSTVNNATTPPASPKMLHQWTGGLGSRSSLGQARSTSSSPSNLPHALEDGCRMSRKTVVCEMLEESMRSLSLGKM